MAAQGDDLSAMISSRGMDNKRSPVATSSWCIEMWGDTVWIDGKHPAIIHYLYLFTGFHPFDGAGFRNHPPSHVDRVMDYSLDQPRAGNTLKRQFCRELGITVLESEGMRRDTAVQRCVPSHPFNQVPSD